MKSGRFGDERDGWATGEEVSDVLRDLERTSERLRASRDLTERAVDAVMRRDLERARRRA